METFLPGYIVGLREGLEAFIIIAVLLEYLDKTRQVQFKKNVWYGVLAGVILSIGAGVVLNIMSSTVTSSAKIWESVVSLIALGLITTFIFWMINHSKNMTSHIHKKIERNFTKWGISLIALTMIAREGAEIVLFSFAGKYPLPAIGIGVFTAAILAILIYFSLIKANLKLIFKITLAYLILQAGYLLGYSIHEGLSALSAASQIPKDSLILTKAFELSATILNHKDGLLGLPLHIIFGWYSKPEWIQFLTQYIYTIGIFVYWFSKSQNSGHHAKKFQIR
ncbi:MAG: FTR1 family protein [Nitrospinae bacterium]|nr:FTR1 family protein [Nitrospinota bacterium]